MEADANEPGTRRKKQRAGIAKNERQKYEGGIATGDLFEKAAGEGALVLAREIVEIDVAKSEEGNEREEEEEKKPCAQGRKAKRGGWRSGGHGREVWRETAGETRRKDGEDVRQAGRQIGGLTE